MVEMARITKKVKLFIVRMLAEFESPTQTSKTAKEVFNIDVTPQQCEAYDPTKRTGQDLSQELRDLFFEYRRKANEELEAIPVANKRYRLQQIQNLLDEHPNNPVFTPKWLELAAKEMSIQQTVATPTVPNNQVQTKAEVELEIKKLELEKLRKEVNPPDIKPPEEDYRVVLNPDEDIPDEPIL